MPFELARRVRLELSRALASDGPQVAVAEATAALAAFSSWAPSETSTSPRRCSAGWVHRRAPAPKARERLTRREQEVLELLTHGLSNAEVRDRLFIRAKTVEHDVGRNLSKLGLRSRAEAAVHAPPVRKKGVATDPPRCSWRPTLR